MLSPVTGTASPGADLPKPPSNSPKDATVTDAYVSHTEDLYLKYTSGDGDVLELHATSSEEMLFHGGTSALPDTYDKTGYGGKQDASGKTTDAAGASDPTKKAWTDVRDWAESMQKELKQQQEELVKQALKQSGKTAVDAGDGKFLMVSLSVTDGTDQTSATDAQTQQPQVPEYWNAENTSNRIVKMATQFAQISGLDPKEFGEKIKDAITKGFDQAHAVTGNLPGAAGKLNKDTKDLTFSKLTKWLEDWEAGAYNQSAQTNGIQTTDVNGGTTNNQ